MNSRRAALCLFCLLAALAAPAYAATISEIFLMLPSGECGGLNVAERQALLSRVTEAPGANGPASVPNTQAPWLRLPADNYLVLQRPRAGDITYKLFEGRSFQLLVICRGRGRLAPGDPVDSLDLSLYRLDQVGLSRAEGVDYLPGISILDFVTADTLADPRAVAAIARLAPTYNECLTCIAGAIDRRLLNIVTATTVNAAACDDFLPPYGLLPLTWNGQIFTKPYDRAAPRDDGSAAEKNRAGSP
jgi:hypothetical protein